MENISALWVLIGMGVMVLGPAGAVWADIRRQVHGIGERIDMVVNQWDRDRKEDREWMKNLQKDSNEHGGDIKVLLDRIER